MSTCLSVCSYRHVQCMNMCIHSATCTPIISSNDIVPSPHSWCPVSKLMTIATVLELFCASEPCLNGGTCMEGGVNSFTCMCLQNFTGPQCQTGIRQNDVYMYMYMTVCGIFQLTCRFNIKMTGCKLINIEVVAELLCASAPCMNGGTCMEGGANGFTCSCPQNFTGVECQTGTLHKQASFNFTIG